MKKNVFVLVLVMVVTFTSSLFSFASESKKELDTKKEIIFKGKMGKVIGQPTLSPQSTTSIVIDLVTAFVEDNLVTIYFNQKIEDDYVSISIRDDSGDILFETSIIVDEAMEISIPIEIDSLTEYILTIYSSKINLVGEF